MKLKFSRSVNREHDPYKVPFGFGASVTVFSLVIAPFAEDLSTKLAILFVNACVWVILGILALSEHPAKQSKESDPE